MHLRHRAQTIVTRRVLAATLALCALVAGPNALWLGASTLRIENATGQPLDAIAYRACGSLHAIGTLAPRESIFVVLEACGDDTLDVRVAGTPGCRLYVEGEMYHVQASLGAAGAVACSYRNLLTSLLITKLL